MVSKRHLLSVVLILIYCLTIHAQGAWLRVNQLGYTEPAIKVAVLAAKEEVAFADFELIDVLTEEVAYRGRTIRPFGAWAAFTHLYRLDFTDFQQPGAYYVRAAGLRSPDFVISNTAYDGAADFLLRYMRQQRCGYNPFLRDSCHTHDGFIVDHPGELDSTRIDVVGGYHDASDYLRYVTTTANTVYQLLFAYRENPAAFGDAYDAIGHPGANGIPDIVDEARWGLDWLDKMNPAPGLMFNQVADDRDHTKFTLPTLDTVSYGRGLERPVYYITGKPQGLGKYKNRATGVASSAAKFASAFAIGAEQLRTYYPGFAEKLAAKAEAAFAYAKTDLGVAQTASNRAPYFYEEDNYVDDMELAAAQLHRLAPDSGYLKQAAYWGVLEPVTPWMKDNAARHYQWYPFVNLGHYQVAAAGDSAQRVQFTGFLRQGLEAIYQRAQGNGFLMGIPFIWCSNNLVAAALTQASLYHELTGDGRYLEMEAALRDWLFGTNPWGTTMIVNFPHGADTPVDPHTAFTAKFGYPIDGGLVDGPVYGSIFNSLIGIHLANGDEYAPLQSDLVVYHDDYGDYSTNEPTMDGTASLSYYFSEMTSQDSRHAVYRHGAIERGDTTSKTIHLVFTGHEFADGGETIRRVLKRNGVKAHFFFTGDFYRNPAHADLIRGLKADGHYLGAHSDRHLLYAPWEDRDSLLVTRDSFIADMQTNYREMARFGISREDAPLFLPPYEWYNDTISSWTRQLGLQLVNFSPGTRSNADYTTPDMGERYVSSETIYRSILDYEKTSKNGLNGFLLLLHVGTDAARKDKFYDRLERLIGELGKRGYKFDLLKVGEEP